MIAPQIACARYRAIRRLRTKRFGFGQATAQDINAEREHRANDEGNAPAPAFKLRLSED